MSELKGGRGQCEHCGEWHNNVSFHRSICEKNAGALLRNAHIITGPGGMCRCGENGNTCSQIIDGWFDEGRPMSARAVISGFVAAYPGHDECKCAACKLVEDANRWLNTRPADPLPDQAKVMKQMAEVLNKAHLTLETLETAYKKYPMWKCLNVSAQIPELKEALDAYSKIK